MQDPCFSCPLACRFFHRACESINNVYAANGVPLAWKVTPSSEQDNMRPDFVLRSSIESSDAGEVDVMVGEGKVRSALWRGSSRVQVECACCL